MYCANQRNPSPYPCLLSTEHMNSSNGRPARSDRSTLPWKNKNKQCNVVQKVTFSRKFNKKIVFALYNSIRGHKIPFLWFAHTAQSNSSAHPRMQPQAHQFYCRESARDSWTVSRLSAVNLTRFYFLEIWPCRRHQLKTRSHPQQESSLSKLFVLKQKCWFERVSVPAGVSRGIHLECGHLNRTLWTSYCLSTVLLKLRKENVEWVSILAKKSKLWVLTQYLVI